MTDLAEKLRKRLRPIVSLFVGDTKAWITACLEDRDREEADAWQTFLDRLGFVHWAREVDQKQVARLVDAVLMATGLIDHPTNGFKPSEVQLPYGEWELLVRKRRDDLDEWSRRWLAEWNRWDMACSPMDDSRRRLIRYGHWLGFGRLGVLL